MSVGGILAG